MNGVETLLLIPISPTRMSMERTSPNMDRPTVNVEIFALYIFSLNSRIYIHCENYYHYSLKSHLY